MRKREAVRATVATGPDDEDGQSASQTRPISSYRVFLVARIIAIAIIFFFNIIWLVRAKVQHGTTHGFGTVDRGACDTIENLNSRMHVVINVLSTVLLASTTTFMILAYSPTRSEIDTAHRKQQHLTVGSIGVRNLSHISGKRAAIYIILLLALAPVHLL